MPGADYISKFSDDISECNSRQIFGAESFPLKQYDGNIRLMC